MHGESSGIGYEEGSLEGDLYSGEVQEAEGKEGEARGEEANVVMWTIRYRDQRSR